MVYVKEILQWKEGYFIEDFREKWFCIIVTCKVRILHTSLKFLLWAFYAWPQNGILKSETRCFHKCDQNLLKLPRVFVFRQHSYLAPTHFAWGKICVLPIFDRNGEYVKSRYIKRALFTFKFLLASLRNFLDDGSWPDTNQEFYVPTLT